MKPDPGTLIVTLHQRSPGDKSPLHMVSASRLADLEFAERELAALRAAIIALVTEKPTMQY